jgi:VWFA-related protein
MGKRAVQYFKKYGVLVLFVAFSILLAGCGGGGGGDSSGDSGSNNPPPFQPPTGITVRINKIDAGSCPLVDAYISVSDQNGVPVVGLTQQDFTVLVDGAQQILNNVTYRELVSEPIIFSMVLDYSISLTDADIANLASAASAFVQDLYSNTNPALNWGEIIKFATPIDVAQDFTDNPSDLTSAIDADYAGRGPGTFLYDALGKAIVDIEALRANPPTPDLPPQSVIIVISDGQDHTSVTYSKDDIIDMADAAGIIVVSIAFGTDVQGQQDLFDIASATNGLYFYAPTSSDVQSALDQLLDNLADQYILSFNSVSGQKLLEIEVTTPEGGQGSDSLDFACP